MYTQAQYRQDLRFSLLIALGFTFIAAIPLAILGVVNLVAYIRQRPQQLPWFTYFAVVVVIPGSYFFAAIVAGTLAFVLRPLRRYFIGWVLTGAVVAATIYGCVGLALAVFYNPVGAAIIDHTTQQELWAMILPITALLAPVGAVVGGYMWWRARQGRPVW